MDSDVEARQKSGGLVCSGLVRLYFIVTQNIEFRISMSGVGGSVYDVRLVQFTRVPVRRSDELGCGSASRLPL